MHNILERVKAGHATDVVLGILKDIADNIHSRTICFFGASAAMPVQSFLKKFPEDFFSRVIKTQPEPVPAAQPAPAK